MSGTMSTITIASLAASVLCGVLYRLDQQGVFLTLTITFGTIFYHLGMRLAVGWAYHKRMGNRADCSNQWYQLRPWEARLYRTLCVKRWKNRLPTFDPDAFSPRLHSWDEIAQAMCQSELVHETIIPLSFCPLILSKWLGSFDVFFTTSVLAAIFDLLFVIIQRYNRPRIIKIASKQQEMNRHKERI